LARRAWVIEAPGPADSRVVWLAIAPDWHAFCQRWLDEWPADHLSTAAALLVAPWLALPDSAR
jgi:hypothetical protein